MEYENGFELSSGDGYFVGYCEQCRYSQPRLYSFEGKLYCSDCFTSVINRKTALLNYEKAKKEL